MNAVRSDFSDRLSPIVVKELRQGLRSRAFAVAFLLMQGLMILCVIIGLVTSQFGNADFSRGFFWAMVSIPLLLVMPARAFNALSGEIKANTLELVFLTRLSASRIVFGKWAALVLQTVLLITAIVPYAVLRYFLGEINLLDELLIIGWMILASALLSGVALASSPFQRSMAGRGLLGFAVVFFLQFGVGLIFSAAGGSGASPLGRNPLLVVAVTAPVFLVFVLQIAIGKIAPAAENHSSRKRLLGLLLIAVTAGLSWAHFDTAMIEVLTVVLLLVICVEALCEEVKQIPSLYAPFARRGLAGKVVGKFLYPGWVSGILYTALVLGLFAAVQFSRGRLPLKDGVEEVAIAGTLFLPLALAVFFPKRKKFLIYVLFFGFMTIVATFLGPMKHTPYADYLLIALPLPLTTLLLNATVGISASQVHEFVYTLGAVTLLSLGVLCWKMARPWKEMAENEAAGLTLSTRLSGKTAP